MWRRDNLVHQLVGTEMEAAPVESSTEGPQKIKTELA